MRVKIPDQLIERAVELWARKLHTPVFDNGDNSPMGGMSFMLATMNILEDKRKISDMDERIKVFSKSLSDSLKDRQEREGYFNTWLSTDYGPCKELADAADVAGIPHSQFSCKSSVSINEDYVSASFGYGARHVCHYPLPDGRWLITDLRGDEDFKKILNHVINGNEMGFTVE